MCCCMSICLIHSSTAQPKTPHRSAVMFWVRRLTEAVEAREKRWVIAVLCVPLSPSRADVLHLQSQASTCIEGTLVAVHLLGFISSLIFAFIFMPFFFVTLLWYMDELYLFCHHAVAVSEITTRTALYYLILLLSVYGLCLLLLLF